MSMEEGTIMNTNDQYVSGPFHTFHLSHLFHLFHTHVIASSSPTCCLTSKPGTEINTYLSWGTQSFLASGLPFSIERSLLKTGRLLFSEKVTRAIDFPLWTQRFIIYTLSFSIKLPYENKGETILFTSDIINNIISPYNNKDWMHYIKASKDSIYSWSYLCLTESWTLRIQSPIYVCHLRPKTHSLEGRRGSWSFVGESHWRDCVARTLT